MLGWFEIMFQGFTTCSTDLFLHATVCVIGPVMNCRKIDYFKHMVFWLPNQSMLVARINNKWVEFYTKWIVDTVRLGQKWPILYRWHLRCIFVAATKQLYKWYFPSVPPSVCLSHLFDYVPIIVSSWNFQELLPMTKVRSMQKVKVSSQRSRPQRSQPNLTVSGL